MQNPFSKEQIKNYLLLYGAIVVIMVLFYILNNLLNKQKSHEQKVFETGSSVQIKESSEKPNEEAESSNNNSRFKLLEKGY
ncbi:MAG: hypothetical protein U9Q62_09710 [Campylobacterota bacterium]|nr:hypothetical protein [Campylobacterota bacterium]